MYRFIGCLLLVAVLSMAAFGQTVIIVNSANPVKAATRAEIANFYLGKTTQWSDGTKAVPIDQKKSSQAGAMFLEKIVKMKESDFKKTWVEKMLSGEAEPLQVKGSDDEVVEFVKANTGAIGYISAKSVADGVKVLPIDGKKEW